MGSFRERIKRVPVAGPALYDLYLKRRYNEGEILTIEGGPLQGRNFKRYMRTYFDGYITGAFEPELLARIASELREGDVFFDIGANNGLMSMAGAEGVGAAGKVVAFEPHPKTADELREQMRINNLDHIVQVEEIALSNEDGLVEFSDDGPSDMLGIASIDDQVSARTIMVPAARLDSLIERLGPPAAMKIDVEGADMWVLEGATAVLAEHKPLIFMELHTPEIAVEYNAFMEPLGYKHFEMDDTAIVGPIKSRHVISRVPR